MKTRAIPAQITTVEDRIAGNLNLTQITLLMLPVFWLMIVYAVLPQTMHISLYKIPLIALVTMICLLLAIRIKGKVALQWLIILLKYNTRPRYYLYNKNEQFLRDIVLPTFRKRQKKVEPVKESSDEGAQVISPFAELARLEHFASNHALSLSIKTGRKGGVNVAIEQK